MSASAKRVEELLERWLASVDLHLRYLKLDDAAYARAEAWPQHQRPNAFVVNLARTRLQELRSHLVGRRDAGDTRFAESLELMSFLTSLLGSEHIERFIPLATGKTPDTGISSTIEQPRIRPSPKSTAGHRSHSPARSTGTTAVQKTSTGTHRRPSRPAAVSTAVPAAPTPATAPAPVAAPPPVPRETVSRQLVAPRPRPVPEPRAAAARAPEPPVAAFSKDVLATQVIADAIRMLEWGREWPALAGLIARMADRPSETEIWKILRAHRAEILAKARRSAG